MKRKILFIISILPLCLFAQQEKTVYLIEKGSEWKYYDKASYPGDNWIKKSFGDDNWAKGNAEFGYGDGDEKTVISHGEKENEKQTTAYFRKIFDVTTLEGFKTIELNIKRDDGAVVYINGIEAFRTNMPKGKIMFNTLASSAISGGSESMFINAVIDPKMLQKGKNIIAVEVHQDSPTSSDLSFDLSLTASKSTGIIRGPYLQSATPTSIIVRWRTTSPVPAKIHYGTTTTFTDSVMINEPVTDHTVQLSNLKPYTKYFYSISSANESPVADSNYFFLTPPENGTPVPVRIWSMGDFGSTGNEQIAARDAYYRYSKNTYTNLILWLGDDAYPSGTDEQYGTNVFAPYRKILSQTVAYSTSGNHDLFSSNVVKETGPYFDIFNFPKNGEGGGVKSGSEAYYSFDYGDIHFVCLESNIDSFGDRKNAMLEWLKADLSANKSKWTIAYFHFAIYSKGYHDSDVNGNMIWMRKNVAPILEQYNTDLVLSGHLHDYERTPLLKGYYGDAASLTKSMIIDKGTGKDTLVYKKPANAGTMYVIAGCMGEPQPVDSKSWPHPATVKTYQRFYGTLVIDINGNKLDGILLGRDGKLADHFVIQK